jgi:ABC-type transport system involved in Fe-S cluster assembly fused permease/ATPase subunit
MHSLPIEYHRSIQAGEKQKIIDRGAESIWEIGDKIILIVLPQILIFLTLLVSGLWVNPLFTLLSLIFLPV